MVGVLKHMKLLSIALISLAIGCKINTSTTGADTGGANNFSVEFFKVKTAQGSPILAQRFTEEFRDFVQNQSPLRLIEKEGQLQYSGDITGYAIRPVAVQANETAALNRLSITVRVVYVNTLDKKKNLEKSFTAFADYPTTEILSSVEDDLLSEIFDQLFQDIYNASLGSW